ncbi:CoA-binding protein [Candidatus Micrarchaeota archaeon]|nr:CoA-binding protein [Candidatus Micrarchaeota archaeon]
MEIAEMLKKYKHIAVVGVSRDESKDSRIVFEYLKAHGYIVYPVNPNADEIGGQKCYASVAAIPHAIDIVDIFRPSAEVLPIVREAVKKKAKVVWMQLGIVNEEAAALARKNGLEVVMGRCMMVEHRKLGI